MGHRHLREVSELFLQTRAGLWHDLPAAASQRVGGKLARAVALYRLSLAPKARASIFVEVCCDQPKESRPLAFFHAMFAAKRDLKHATLRAASVLKWIDGPADMDQDGFAEYYCVTEKGLANQGWKDSLDAVFHADGRLAEGPIALSEEQGYIYAAKLLAAKAARRLGWERKALDLEDQAQQLAARFESAFWCPELETYAPALDGAKRPCRVRTSNAGQLLFTGIVKPEHAARIAQGLLGPEFFSGWGIRTVSSVEQRYNPMSYHNGSIWPHDNALIALGFARYGHKRAIDKVFRGLIEAATYMDLRRLPELSAAFSAGKGEVRRSTRLPVHRKLGRAARRSSCCKRPWDWSSIPCRMKIRIPDPHLPSFLESVLFHNLRLGESRVDIMAHRHAGNVSIEIVRAEGSSRVTVIPGQEN